MAYFVWQRTIADTSGDVIANASVAVRDALTNDLVQLYSDATGSAPLGNPVKADSTGFVRFFAAEGRYNITATSGGFSRTWSNEWLGRDGEIKQDDASAEIAATPEDYSHDALPVLDVRRYGYAADDLSDNAAALGAAIAVAGELGGAVIQLPPGIGRISSSVIVDQPNVLFRGAGRKATVIRATADDFNLFVPRAAHIGFESMGFHGAAEAVGEQWAIFTAIANPATYLSVRGCYFGGSAADARLNDAIKFDEDCDYGLVDDCVIDQVMGVDRGGGYGVLAGAVRHLRINNLLGFAAGGKGRHLVYLSTGAEHCYVANCFGVDWQSETYTLNSTGAQPANAYNVFESCVAVGGNPDNTSTGAFSIFGKATSNVFRNCRAISPGQKGFILIARSASAADLDLLDTVFENCESIGAGREGLDINGTTRTKVVGGRYVDSSQLSVGAYANIRLVATAEGGQASTDCELVGVTANGTSANCALQLNPTSPVATGTRVRAPLFGPGNAGVGGVVVNSGSIAYDGPKGGRATIPSGSTSVVVAHLLGRTPAADELSLQVTENSTSNQGDVWISGVDATAFTINCRIDPGASNLVLTWHYAPADDAGATVPP